MPKSLAAPLVFAAFLFSLWAIAGAGQEAVFYGFLLLMAGTPFYVFLKSRPAGTEDRGASR